MEIDDLNKYVLDQAKIEIEHTRSWPNKLLAFYVAINFGVAGSILTLASRENPVHISDFGNTLIIIFATLFFVFATSLLIKNHLTYLRHRNLQIQFQINHSEEIKERKFKPPKEWFQLNKVSLLSRPWGWGFYFSITFLVTVLTITAVLVAKCL